MLFSILLSCLHSRVFYGNMLLEPFGELGLRKGVLSWERKIKVRVKP